MGDLHGLGEMGLLLLSSIQLRRDGSFAPKRQISPIHYNP